jgi:CRISPR-associated Csx3 family protein
VIIDVILSRGLIEPRELPALLRAVEAHVPAGGTEGVVLSGRLPVWAFAALVHFFHPRPWVATFDPRLEGGVVVMSHDPSGPAVGDVVPTDGATTVTVEFYP